MIDERPNFYGHQPRDCGEHRTVGPHRAWCYGCSEWCYPSDGCMGCRLPALESVIAAINNMCRDPGGPDSWTHTFDGEPAIMVADVLGALGPFADDEPTA